MSLRLVATLIFLLPTWLQAQKLDTLSTSVLTMDSTTATGQNKLDFIELSAGMEYTSLKTSYDSIITSADNQAHHLQGKIDSLQNLNLSASDLTSKLDSVIKWKDEKLSLITLKVEKLSATVKEKIKELNLPPELYEKANEVTSVMSKLDIALPNTTLPESLPNQLNIPTANPGDALKLPGIPGMNIGSSTLQDLNVASVNTGSIREQVQHYQTQIADLPTDLEGAAEIAEEQATKITDIKSVQAELGKVDELSKTAAMLQDEEKLKEQLIKEAKEQASDHFADKKDQLDKAMQSISKYKKKFPTISSLNDIPKKAPNEMKGKPLIERVVPGIAFQLQKKNDDWLLDINPYIAYRFTKRLSSGAGWNQRIGFNMDNNRWSPEDARIYGPRVFSEYKLGKGFSPRVEFEVMNTFVPPYIKSIPVDPGTREWVWGAFVGMKKDYTLYKKVKGTAVVMVRLFDPHRKSPYADVINARFGFELPMKKKVKGPKVDPN